MKLWGRYRTALEVILLIVFIGMGALIAWNCTSASAGGPRIVFPEDNTLDRSDPSIAEFWREMDEGKVQCQLCFRNCVIAEGQRGECDARVNRDGKLYSLVYGMAGAVQANPVEKEPLMHFLPGTSSLSMGTASCNFKCSFCQNWQMATKKPEDVNSVYLSPQKVVDKAKELDCPSISFTYNEPTVCYEWMYDVARLAQENGVKTYFHTNGGINPEPLKELIKYMDAVCVDVKGFTAEFYIEISFSDLEPVLLTLTTLKESGTWFEITCLIIPTLNDDPAKIEEMCRWIRDNLGDEVPVQFSRFFPAYKLKKIPPTPIDTLEKAYEIAQGAGLKYVTIGNVPGHEGNNTYCPDCGKPVIKRVDFSVVEYNLKQGKCRFCGQPIPGVWQ